jgi:hypothetical protein
MWDDRVGHVGAIDDEGAVEIAAIQAIRQRRIGNDRPRDEAVLRKAFAQGSQDFGNDRIAN